jgi:hypothetical protein
LVDQAGELIEQSLPQHRTQHRPAHGEASSVRLLRALSYDVGGGIPIRRQLDATVPQEVEDERKEGTISINEVGSLCRGAAVSIPDCNPGKVEKEMVPSSWAGMVVLENIASKREP